MPFLREKAQSVANQSTTRVRSTLTPAERFAFRNLKRAPEPAAKQGAQPDAATDPLNVDSQRILDIFTSSIKAHQANQQTQRESRPTPERSREPKIMSAIPEVGLEQENDWRSFKPTSESSLIDEGKQALELAATEVRAGAADADLDRIAQKRMAGYAATFSRAIESTRVRGDVALWRALEEQVWPMIHHLKPEGKATATEKDAANRVLPLAKILSDLRGHQPDSSSSSSRSSSSSETNTANNVNNPAGIQPPSSAQSTPLPSTASPRSLALNLITRLYPACTLLALRLFATHFPTSPYTSTLIPRLRALGPASYVLAANIHLYNTLLSVRWKSHSSLREIASLLAEMERGGVEFDRGTHAFLAAIAHDRARDTRLREDDGDDDGLEPVVGGDGGRAQVWWKRPEQEKWFAIVEYWKDLIARRLDAKGEGVVYREGPSEHGGAGAGVAIGLMENEEGGRGGRRERRAGQIGERAIWL